MNFCVLPVTTGGRYEPGRKSIHQNVQGGANVMSFEFQVATTKYVRVKGKRNLNWDDTLSPRRHTDAVARRVKAFMM